MNAPADDRTGQGLTAAEASTALARDGPNVLPSKDTRNVARIALDILREPMFLLLVGCAAIYLVLGEASDAWVLIAFVGVVLGITIVQERRTERALDALRDLSSPRALVIRDGVRVRIAGRDVVAGDLIVLEEGDRVAADGVVVDAHALSTDESLLTGESVPVRKLGGDPNATWGPPGGDDLPFVYSGSLVVAGAGLARVVATGPRTELGRIGRSLFDIEPGRTRLQADTDRLVRRVSIVALLACVAAAVTFGVQRGQWLEGALAGIAIAMSLLPEEFAVVLTVFLALGAWRLSQHRVLTRRIPAIEALGAATALCVDKTGTLTENRMRVAGLVDADGREWRFDGAAKGAGAGSAVAPVALPEAFHRLVEFTRLATPDDPFDPMERALLEVVEQTIAGTEHIHRDWTLLHEYPLSPRLLSMSRAWRRTDATEIVIAAKGAPEAILDLCHLTGGSDASPHVGDRDVGTRDGHGTDLPGGARDRDAFEARIDLAVIRARIDALAASGYRVIAVAAAHLQPTALPDDQHAFDFRFVGLIALADPLREGVADAIDECHRAGIRVVMITGDLPGTAVAIAGAIGLPSSAAVLTGPEITALDDAALSERLARACVIARAVPDQKLRIVRMLQAQRHVVAMTGDGVNDAPALKAADIGIAMGRRGADVAREAAALVLLDDDFASIVRAVKMGRRIHANLKKAVSYIIAVHLPIAGVALVPIFAGWPVALMPAHIAFLELIIDPACSLAFEAEPADADIMNHPPRDASQSLYSGIAVWFGVIEGLLVTAFALGAYAAALYVSTNEAEIRAIAFSALVLGNLVLLLAGRSTQRASRSHKRPPNPVVGWIVTGTLAGLAAVLAVPPLRGLFRLAVPSWTALAGVGVAMVLLWASLIALRAVTDRISSRREQRHTGTPAASTRAS